MSRLCRRDYGNGFQSHTVLWAIDEMLEVLCGKARTQLGTGSDF